MVRRHSGQQRRMSLGGELHDEIDVPLLQNPLRDARARIEAIASAAIRTAEADGFVPRPDGKDLLESFPRDRLACAKN